MNLTPACTLRPAAASTTTSASFSPAVISVFLIEEQAAHRQRLHHALRQAGWCRVAGCCATPEEARPYYEWHKPRLVLLAVGPSTRSRLAHIAWCRSKLPGAKVLVLVEEEEPELLLKALANGACGYYVKTEPARRLLEALEKVREGGAAVSARLARHLVDFLQNQTVRMQPTEPLSWREQEILDCLSQGYPYKQIADRLQISINTVRTYVRRLYAKLEVPCRAHAMLKCLPRSQAPAMSTWSERPSRLTASV